MKKIAAALCTLLLAACALAAPAQAGQGGALVRVPVVVQNSADIDIYFLYMSASSDEFWSEDLLGNYVLEPGGSLEAALTVDRADTVWDILLVDGDDNEFVWYDVEIGDWLDSGLSIDLQREGEDLYIDLAALDPAPAAAPPAAL